MAILKKTVKKYGTTCMVGVPRDWNGKEVWIVSEPDMGSLQEVLEMTLLYRKAYKHDQSEFHKDYKNWKIGVENRLKRIEDLLISP